MCHALVRLLNLIECWPCSVWAWCDCPVYHPAPECSDETLREGFPGHVRKHPSPADFTRDNLRALPDEIAATLPSYWQRARIRAQRRYKRWHRRIIKSGTPAEMGFGLVEEKAFAALMQEDYLARPEAKQERKP